MAEVPQTGVVSYAAHRKVGMLRYVLVSHQDFQKVAVGSAPGSICLTPHGWPVDVDHLDCVQLALLLFCVTW